MRLLFLFAANESGLRAGIAGSHPAGFEEGEGLPQGTKRDAKKWGKGLAVCVRLVAGVFASPFSFCGKIVGLEKRRCWMAFRGGSGCHSRPVSAPIRLFDILIRAL